MITPGRILCIMVLMLLSSLPAAAQSSSTPAVLAQVGDQKLSREAFEGQLAMLPPHLQTMIKASPKMQQEIIHRWVYTTLLAKEAESLGLPELPEIRLKMKQMRNHLLIEKLLSMQIPADNNITAEDAERYFQDHKNDFVLDEQIHARHILIALPDNPSPQEQLAAEQKIKIIRDKLREGADFASLAKQFSDDLNSKDSGGDLGFFGKGKMIKEFEDAAFSLPVEKVSPPVKTVFGYHLIQVIEKKPGRPQQFEEVQDLIKSYLLQQQKQKAIDHLLTELKKKYQVFISSK